MERYYSLSSYLKNKFGVKVGKVCLDGGFTCPNRDGTLSNLGCIYCSERGSGEFAGCIGAKTISEQIAHQKTMYGGKWKVEKYIAYFQNFTNTYKPVSELRKIYDEALSDKDIVGLDIATRADCMDLERIELLKEYDEKTETWIELGMQSIHEKTLDFINRGYSHEYFDKKACELIDEGFKIIVHMILGLPTETREDMLETFEYVKELHPFGVKIHSLYVDKHSRLGKLYTEKPFPVLTEEEYVNLVCDGMEILPRDIVYHRITGDPVRENLIVPDWTKHKCAVISSIQKELKKRNIDFVDGGRNEN